MEVHGLDAIAEANATITITSDSNSTGLTSDRDSQVAVLGKVKAVIVVPE